jgi:hypothetical protein
MNTAKKENMANEVMETAFRGKEKRVSEQFYSTRDVDVLCPVCGGADICFFTKHHGFEGCQKHELYWIERTGHFGHHTDEEFLETALFLSGWGFIGENDAHERVIYSAGDEGVKRMLFKGLSGVGN